MSAVDAAYTGPPALAGRVAAVRAQLAPIRTRRALLDSYRNESLCRFAHSTRGAEAAAKVLEFAYALRWLELDGESNDPPVATGKLDD
jgi:hypothetical protein